MIAHPRFRRLTLTSLDFPATASERRELDDHLAGCDACSRYAQAVRADAEALRALAFADAPDRVRAVVAQAAARPAGRTSGSWQLLLAAVLLLLLALGAVLAVGALLRLQPERAGPIAWQPAAADLLSDPAASVRLTAVAGGSAPAGSAITTRFLAVATGAGGAGILVSDDGVAWRRLETPALEGTALQIRALEFLSLDPAGGRFVAGGALGGRPAVALSADGASWTFEPLPGVGEVLAVGARGGHLVAVGRAADGPGFWHREQGGAWRAGTLQGDTTFPDEPPTVIVDTPRGILGIAPGQTYRSGDGTTWAEEANDLGVAARLSVVARGEQLVAAGDRAGGPPVWSSSDGTRWQPGTLPGQAGAPVAIVDGGDAFIAVGGGPAGGLTWSSINGIVWSVGAPMPASDGARLVDLAIAGDRFVAIGVRGTDGSIWYGTEADQ